MSPKKIMRMLVLPLQLFLDDLMHLNDSSSIALHLKTHFIPKSKQDENTTIIPHEIDKLRLQILEALHIKTKKKPLKPIELILKIATMF